MKKINNLIYTLEINFVNNEGVKSSISVKFCDDGLKVKSVKIGDVCITEETINGRVLSGRLDNLDGYCGYRYDYQNGENLLNINPDVSINDAVYLINKMKMESGFLTAELVLSSILRNDYRVVILKEGALNVIKTISAENENAEHCTIQESIDLLKIDGEENFAVQSKKRVYKIKGNFVVEENQSATENDIKSQLNELLSIIDFNPQNYKQLIEIKNKIQKENNSGLTNEEKSL